MSYRIASFWWNTVLVLQHQVFLLLGHTQHAAVYEIFAYLLQPVKGNVFFGETLLRAWEILQKFHWKPPATSKKTHRSTLNPLALADKSLFNVNELFQLGGTDFWLAPLRRLFYLVKNNNYGKYIEKIDILQIMELEWTKKNRKRHVTEMGNSKPELFKKLEYSILSWPDTGTEVVGNLAWGGSWMRPCSKQSAVKPPLPKLFDTCQFKRQLHSPNKTNPSFGNILPVKVSSWNVAAFHAPLFAWLRLWFWCTVRSRMELI